MKKEKSKKRFINDQKKKKKKPYTHTIETKQNRIKRRKNKRFQVTWNPLDASTIFQPNKSRLSYPEVAMAVVSRS